MKNNRSNRSARSLNLNKKSVSKLNEETVNGGRAQCSILVRDTEVCFTKESPCATYNALCEEN
jgi:hypothetical protein